MAKEQKRAVTRRCHAGLADAVVPIYNRDILLGFIIFGQIDVSDGKRTTFDEIYERVKDLDIDREALKAAYENSVFSDRKKIDSAAEIVSILTKYILFEHLIELEREKTSDGVARYIDENIAEELGVDEICRRFHISKSMLYREFKVRFGCTVGEYITAKRMELAEQLLRTTEDSISDISERCGIENCQYFCRVFKKNRGITPLQYRKSVQR
jgi:AraC-like DNA-binding protein